MKKLILLSFILFFTFSCSDAKKARIKGRGSEFRIEMLNCDGTIARSWISTGKARSEQNSDGYYFMDKTMIISEWVSGFLYGYIPH